MLIRCTQKLFSEIGIDPKALATDSLKSNTGEIDEWYANLTSIERKKYIVFMNASTHFVTISFCKRKQEIQQFRDLFADSLEQALKAEAVQPEIIKKFLQNCKTITLDKTNDRRSIGCLSDIIHQAKLLISVSQDQGEGGGDMSAIAKKLNRVPWVKARYPYAIDGMQDLMQSDLNWDGQFTH